MIKEKETKENDDGSVFIDDMHSHMKLFEQKKELFLLAKQYSNEQLSKKRVVTNIN